MEVFLTERESMNSFQDVNITRRSFMGMGVGSAAALALAGCGGGGTEGGATSGGAFAGLICHIDENSTYDLCFINDFKAACEGLGLSEGEYLIKTNVAESDAALDAASELVDAGCKIVFADSYGHQDYLIEAAKEFPEVHFVSCTGDKALTEGLDNFHNAFAEIFNGRFLAGVAAGLKLQELKDAGKLKSDTPKMGYVGAFTYAEVVSGYTSFFLGAKSIVEDVTMDVTFTGSWGDEALEKEAATKLINNGASVISQHADTMGAPTACENAGVFDVSYNGSTVDACPKTFIVSTRIDWEPYFTYAIGAVQNDEAFDTDWTGTLATGSIVMTEVNEQAAAEGTVEKLQEVEAQLADGSVHVFDTSTFTVKGKKLKSYQANVEPDEGFEGDTEVVSDGYFHESEYRSAPYFDLQIDGINLLDTKF